MALSGDRRCPACGEMMPLAGFPRNRARRGGYASKCKPCTRACSQRYREADPARAREQARIYSQRYRARKKGQELPDLPDLDGEAEETLPACPSCGRGMTAIYGTATCIFCRVRSVITAL